MKNTFNDLLDWIGNEKKMKIELDPSFYLSVPLMFSCQLDSDDEVRDRATFYVNVLKQGQKALSSAYILNGRFKCLYRSVID